MSSAREPTRRIKRLRLTRRELLRAAQLGGLVAGTAGLGLFGREQLAEARSKGVCRFCTMHCGVVATTRGGRLVRVEGDLASRTKGFICHHGQALREVVHSDERLRLPLLRDGDAFREVPWDEALTVIARRLLELRDRHGARAVGAMTGWPFVRHPMVWMLHRFLRAFGSPNLATVASLCEATGRMGKALVAGSNMKPDLRHAKTLVVWGANPTFAAPPFAHLVAGFAENGKQLVVVDPVRTELAQAATLHLSIRPGTDGALALGLLDVVLREGLFDAAFVEANTRGLEGLRALAAQYPLERTTALTSVPAEQLQRAARLIASDGPVSLWDGLGVEHHENGVQTVRAITALFAVTGHLDVPGGDQLLTPAGSTFYDELLPPLYRMSTPRPVPPPLADRPIGYEEYPLYEVFNREAQGMLFPRAVLEGKPYPLRGLLLFGTNPLVTAPQSAQWEKAFDALDLAVCVDPFLSPTAERCDVVLPAATFAEAPSVEGGGFLKDGVDDLVARSALVRAQHHSQPDWKVLFELARKLGLGEYFPWTTFAEAMESPRLAYMEDEPHQPRPLPRAQPASPPPRWPTPSGKLELASTLLERFSQPPLPEWTPPSERLSAEYPLWLVSGPRTRPFINSQFRNVPSVAARASGPTARLHPTAAARLGVKGGTPVEVVTARGRVRLVAEVTELVHPEVVVVPNGWAEASANALTDLERRDPISGFPAFRSLACRVEPVGQS